MSDPQSMRYRQWLGELTAGSRCTAFHVDRRCPTCGVPNVDPRTMRDDLSRREWQISAMCQDCQDLVFDSD